MRELLLNLVAHMRWADALVASAIARDSSPDAEAVRLFAHVASAEHLWYSRIFAQPAQHAVWPNLSVAVARALAAEHADLFEQLVSSADTLRLAETVRYRNSAGHDFTNSVSEIVTHVAMHGSHHRGQIARSLRSAGQEPPYVDYIQFMRRDQ
jgi:uncharacterized damage-inducible protein DinB